MEMVASNRTARRKAAVRAKTLAVAVSVAAAAAAVTASVAPLADTTARHLEVALTAAGYPKPVDCGASTCYVQPAYGLGVLGGLITPLLNQQGLNPFASAALDNSGFEFLGGFPTTRQIYDAINSLAYYPSGGSDPQCRNAAQTSCRAASLFATGIGTLGASDTVHALIESAQGNTRKGFDPLSTADGSEVTDVSVTYINNMLRPNGGIAARFPELMKLIGLDSAMPITGEVGPNQGDSSVFSTISDLTWAYNTLADFPITANPFSLVNSAFAAIPPPDVIQAILAPDPGSLSWLNGILYPSAGTLSGKPEVTPNSLPPYLQTQQAPCGGTANLCFGYGGVVPLLLPSNIIGAIPDFPEYYPYQATYSALGAYNATLPLLYPNAVGPLLVNQLLKAVKSPYLLGNPLNDVLTPMMKILVNIGYDDVVTPADLNTVNPYTNDGQYTYAKLGYQAYDRTFYQLTPDKPTPFAWFNNPGMTADEMAAVPGDVWNAFTAALKAQSEKPLFGILVPNPDNPPAGAATPVVANVAAAQTVSAPAPAAAVATVATPVESAQVAQSEPVSTPTLSTPAPLVGDEAPEPAIAAVSVPDVQAGAADDPEPAAPAAPAHRGAARAAAATIGDSHQGSGQAGGGDNGGSRTRGRG